MKGRRLEVSVLKCVQGDLKSIEEDKFSDMYTCLYWS